MFLDRLRLLGGLLCTHLLAYLVLFGSVSEGLVAEKASINRLQVLKFADRCGLSEGSTGADRGSVRLDFGACHTRQHLRQRVVALSRCGLNLEPLLSQVEHLFLDLRDQAAASPHFLQISIFN